MEDQIRLAAFQWLEEKVTIYGNTLSRTLLEKGFEFKDHQIHLLGPQGIWKPKEFRLIPLSITTIPGGPYEDIDNKDGYFTYKYRGTDPNHRDNVGLREAMKKQIPLIYFLGIIPGKYEAIWPVYIVNDNPKVLSFTIAVDARSSVVDYNQIEQTETENNFGGVNEIRRRYITSTVKNRIHQSAFREMVLKAYNEQCALCKLKHTELLDAAHIIPDGNEHGDAVVNNGLSLCKIHHAVFDANIIGITPTYLIQVRTDILSEIDGPMLKYGIQELHNKELVLPKSQKAWPDKDRLNIRYTQFRETG